MHNTNSFIVRRLTLRDEGPAQANLANLQTCLSQWPFADPCHTPDLFRLNIWMALVHSTFGLLSVSPGMNLARLPLAISLAESAEAFLVEFPDPIECSVAEYMHIVQANPYERLGFHWA